jgi:TPP-dependent indolepyruvate ferredoxin oxidoreductase alpha subunit
VIYIDTTKCTGCCGCVDLCPAAAIEMNHDLVAINQSVCMECLICTKVCPMRAPQIVA